MGSPFRRLGLLAPLCLMLAAAGVGCIHRTEPVKLAHQQPVAVAFVQDSESGGEVSDAPDAVKQAVIEALAARNLRAEPIDAAKVQDAFRQVRASERRIAWLQETARTPYVLLVETRARFFSQLSGRYRWVALAKLTALDRSAKAAPTTRDFEEGVVLQFDHERAPQALGVAAPRIGEAAGALFDDLLVVPAPQASRRLPQPGAIYFVMVDRFANGDPSNDGEVDPKDPAAFHGGDLQGVIDHLDELKALGVETLWLSPIFKMRTEKFFGFGAFHGYWVYDLDQVEPRFGDRRLLRRLSDELHRRGMKLLLDVVLNHVGPDAPLVKQKPGWFHRKGALEHWDDPDELVTHDVHGLPDLAEENPEVYAYLLDASVGWIRDVKPDGFRLDAVKHMPVAFWRRYAADVRKVAGDDFLLLGEMLEGDPRILASTWREGGFDAVFDFPLKYAVEDVFCKGQPLTHLAATLSLDRLYEDPASLVTLADNHDLPRIVSACGGDLEKVKQVLTVILTARGTPSLTWGTESALAGAKEPENRGDMTFDAQPLREHIARLIELRREHPSLVSGVPMTVRASDEVFVEARILADEAALVVVNRSELPVDLHKGEAQRVVDFAPREEGRSSRSLLVLPGPLSRIAWRDTGAGERGPAGEARIPPHSVVVCFGDATTPGAFRALHQQAEQIWRGTAKRVDVQVQLGDAAGPEGVLHLIGGAPELGGWNPEVAPAFSKRGARLQLPPGTYEYKLVATREGAEPVWESTGNRVLVVPAQAGVEGDFVDVSLDWEQPAVVTPGSMD